MTEKPVKNLNEKDQILIDNQVYLVEKLERSEIGKHGTAKCRIEAINPKTKEKKVIIKILEDTIETP
jgi:translation elongation factor P/translation initiation factor 5A